MSKSAADDIKKKWLEAMGNPSDGQTGGKAEIIKRFSRDEFDGEIYIQENESGKDRLDFSRWQDAADELRRDHPGYSGIGICWDQTNWHNDWYWGNSVNELKKCGMDHAELIAAGA